MPDRTKYSTRRVLFLLNAVVLVGASEKTCSPLSQLPVEEHSRLSGAVFDTFVTSGVVICAKECLSRHSCKSYNFNLDDGTCELSSEAGPGSNGSVSVTREAPFVFSEAHNWPQRILGVCKDHSCPNNTRCVAASDNGWECVTAYCTTPPAVRDAIVSSPINDLTPVLQSLPLQCIVGYVACGNVTCNPDGTWTTMTCQPVSNCTEVRQLSSTYTDGEYWLYPRQLSGVRVKVYCHAMNSTPSEYISLSTPYVVDATQAPYCTRFYNGYYVFSKFGLDIQNMAINKSDTTFYKKDNRSNIHLSVGTVVGCSSVANSTCGPTGRFVMDLRGTGLSFKTTTRWIVHGRLAFLKRPWTLTWSSNNQLVDFLCEAECGYCFVYGPISLSMADTDGNNAVNVASIVIPPENSATSPTCDRASNADDGKMR